MKHNKWTFTSKPITGNRITFGFSFAWYPSGWGMCLNLFVWYLDVNYRTEMHL